MFVIAIDPSNQTERENYKLLIGSIIPRPIAFVTTLSTEEVLNAAPFSYFTIVTADPPMVAVSVQRRQGQYKDTSRNAIAKGSSLFISLTSHMSMRLIKRLLHCRPMKAKWC